MKEKHSHVDKDLECGKAIHGPFSTFRCFQSFILGGKLKKSEVASWLLERQGPLLPEPP